MTVLDFYIKDGKKVPYTEEQKTAIVKELNSVDYFLRRQRRAIANVYAEHKKIADGGSDIYAHVSVMYWKTYREWGESGMFSKFDKFSPDHTGVEYWNARILPKIEVIDALMEQLEFKKNMLIGQFEVMITVLQIEELENNQGEIWDSKADFLRPLTANQPVWLKLLNRMLGL